MHPLRTTYSTVPSTNSVVLYGADLRYRRTEHLKYKSSLHFDELLLINKIIFFF